MVRNCLLYTSDAADEEGTVIEFGQIGPDRRVRYGRFFASVMVRFGPRR